MILVNNPGTWAHLYWPLGHAPWHGWTPTDLVFPFFLFVVGVSMALSFASRLDRGATRASLAWRVLRRSAIIFAIGMFLHGFPQFRLATIRIPGVLQRIAVCYLMAGLVVLALPRRGRGLSPQSSGTQRVARLAPILSVISVLLVGYWALMTFVPVPGYGAGRLDVEGNLAAYVDRWLMLGHLWKPTWDPEGVLSTFPAITTVLIGVLVGEWLRTKRDAPNKVAGLLAVGAAGLILGKLLDPFFPINKNLWTSTYVIFTGGFAMVLLGLIYWFVDIKGWRRWGMPFLVFGTNAITVFALSSLVAKASSVFKTTVAGPDGIGPPRLVSWHTYIYQELFAPLASPKNGSLLFALSYVLLWLALMSFLYRRRIFIKI